MINNARYGVLGGIDIMFRDVFIRVTGDMTNNLPFADLSFPIRKIIEHDYKLKRTNGHATTSDRPKTPNELFVSKENENAVLILE